MPDLRRRQFITLLGSAAAWPFAARAQQAAKVYRLGQLSGGTAASRVPLLAAFMRGMRDLGYVEGQNLVVEHRYAEGRFEVLPALARELLAWNADVLFVSTTPASLAAKAATSTVPIVMVSVADPLGVGLIASLSRPGGNVTGVTNIGSELAGTPAAVVPQTRCRPRSFRRADCRPGAIGMYADDIEKYRNKKYDVESAGGRLAASV